MTEYIDRDAFLASKVFLVAGTLDDYDQGYMDGVDAVEEAAKKFPAADVRPVVRGKWEPIYISEDGGRSTYFLHIQCGCEVEEKSNYCPNCGEQMDGGEAE